jgi:diguanylate cyclase (GGDEF)-like protein
LNFEAKSRNYATRRSQFITIVPFVLILGVLVGLSLWELKFQDGGRVFLVGENLWAGAQKRASFCLLSYSISKSPEDLQCFKSEADVVLGDMQARNELDTSRQTYSVIAGGLVRGRLRAQDVPIAIIFYNIAPWNKEVEKAIQIWRDSDPRILRLVAISGELENSRNRTNTQRLQQEILSIDFALSKQEHDFTLHLNNGMHFLALCLCAMQGAAALVLVLLALFVSHRIMAARASAQQKIHFLAYYDPLSGLPNRTQLYIRLQSALAEATSNGEKVAVLFLDIDHFKLINDSLGHAVGDKLLKEVADRLQNNVRDSDTVARVGGDEFLVVLANLEDAAAAKGAGDRILRAVSTGFSHDGALLNISCSIGISVFPENGTDCETLIKNADAAMYCAKEAGRNRLCSFVEQINTAAVERLNLENNLRVALDRQEFHLVYQPQMEIASNKLTGVEALIRWRHARLGLVPPDKFIPVAENCGLIRPIGEWVLRTACQQARSWQDQGFPAFPVAVNVSAIQFRHEGFCDLVRSVLRETKLPPAYLELELTESVLLSNEDVMFRVLDELKSMGVKLTLDDFGTGYSSLSYLRKFPVTKIKIDRSFIKEVPHNSSDAAIATAIISMARHLNLKVIAEGVENGKQLSFLRSQRCDEIQGYYCSRPLSPTEFVSRFSAPPRPLVEFEAVATSMVQ